MGKNILLIISYDGSCFHGWQKQPEERTVQGYLEETLTRLFSSSMESGDEGYRPISLAGTSRTDAGVHALGLAASFKADINIPTEKLAMVINNSLAARERGDYGTAQVKTSYAQPPVRVLEAREMPEDFHARFDCKGKEYIYKIRCGGEPSVFERNYVYWLPEELDVTRMNRSAQALIGTHDFKSFEAAGGNPRETTVRTIYDAYVQKVDYSKTYAIDDAGKPAARVAMGSLIEFHVKGDGFLYNMVRIMAGTLIEIGQEKRISRDIRRLLDVKDRTEAGFTAPPGGLYLAKVFYDEEELKLRGNSNGKQTIMG